MKTRLSLLFLCTALFCYSHSSYANYDINSTFKKITVLKDAPARLFILQKIATVFSSSCIKQDKSLLNFLIENKLVDAEPVKKEGDLSFYKVTDRGLKLGLKANNPENTLQYDAKSDSLLDTGSIKGQDILVIKNIIFEQNETVAKATCYITTVTDDPIFEPIYKVHTGADFSANFRKVDNKWQFEGTL